MRSVAVVALFVALPLMANGQDKGTVVDVGGFKATTPADWKKEKPSNLLRSFQFRLPEVKDLPGSEIIVSPESPSAEKSFPRWKTQFVPPEGKTLDDVAKISKWDVKGATVSVLDVSGTWKYKERPQDPTSKEMLLDNYRVVWVIVAETDGTATYLRMSGPQTSVDAQFKGFEAFVKALK